MRVRNRPVRALPNMVRRTLNAAPLVGAIIMTGWARAVPERTSSIAPGPRIFDPSTVPSNDPTGLSLNPLPKPPSLEVRAPTPASVEALDAHLAQLVGRDASERETAVEEILEVEPDAFPAIHERLGTLAESSDHAGMKDVLASIRDRTRQESGKNAPAPDHLEMLESHARPDSKNWQELVRLLAMSRMLQQIGTVPAAREIIGIYARFGDFMRIDAQIELEKLGDRAVAALIEAERHPAPKIARWATRQLDTLGKAIPSEAIQTNDPEVLADILRAYGRARNPDAARLVISFANSERAQVRDAAREAVVLMGEVANWQLRDTYENVVGKKPPREWSWDRSARELFAQYDRLRLSQVNVLFAQGLAAERAGKLNQMVDAYDAVLAQTPMFERSTEMIPGYIAYAKMHIDEAPDEAAQALRRVTRLSADGPEGKPAQSLLLTLDAERLLARHVADEVLVRRALELDPTNARARRLLEQMSHGDTEVQGRARRYVAASVILVLALTALAFILFRRRPVSAESSP